MNVQTDLAQMGVKAFGASGLPAAVIDPALESIRPSTSNPGIDSTLMERFLRGMLCNSFHPAAPEDAVLAYASLVDLVRLRDLLADVHKLAAGAIVHLPQEPRRMHDSTKCARHPPSQNF